LRRTCNTYGRDEKCIQNFNRETLKKPRRRWEENIKVDFKEIRYEEVDWIRVALDRFQWRNLVYTVMNIQVP